MIIAVAASLVLGRHLLSLIIENVLSEITPAGAKGENFMLGLGEIYGGDFSVCVGRFTEFTIF
jgi:hypothetical protein